MPETSSNAEFLRKMVEWFKCQGHLDCARRLDTMADEIDPDTNAGEAEVNG